MFLEQPEFACGVRIRFAALRNLISFQFDLMKERRRCRSLWRVAVRYRSLGATGGSPHACIKDLLLLLSFLLFSRQHIYSHYHKEDMFDSLKIKEDRPTPKEVYNWFVTKDQAPK